MEYLLVNYPEDRGQGISAGEYGLGPARLASFPGQLVAAPMGPIS